jgi:Na+/H+ antiporter NhaC
VNHSFFSVLPFLVVIPVAIWLKEIMLGLTIGLLVGSFGMHPTLLGGLHQAADYILLTLDNAANTKIMAFLYLFGGFVGMMQISGGIKGLSNWLEGRLKSERSLLWLIWLTIPITFMTPMFRIMMLGPIVKSLSGKRGLSKEKIGYTLDVSTEPMIVLLPVATAFVGFMISVVSGALAQNQLAMNAYSIYLASIPFNFFAIVMLAIGLYTTFRTSKSLAHGMEEGITADEPGDHHRDCINKELEEVKGQPWNLILPLFVLLFLTLFLLWKDGSQKGAATWLSAFSLADATYVMLLAIFISLLFAFLFYLLRREPLPELFFHFFDGGSQMMPAIILLTLVWATSLSAKDLGFSQFIASTVGSFLPGFLVPAITFLLGSAVSYFIGTSWGTWGLFMPLGVSLAVVTHGPVAMTIGAVFASGTFGAFASPLGDTTITTASIMEMPLVEYAKYKLKISLLGGSAATCLYIFFGYFASRLS